MQFLIFFSKGTTSRIPKKKAWEYILAPEIQVTRKKIELFFLVSQSLRNSIHLSNPFYLRYFNNKLPAETQSCSPLPRWPFRQHFFTTAKKEVQVQRSPGLPRYKFGATMHKDEGQWEAGTSLPQINTEEMHSQRNKHHWIWSQTEAKAQTSTTLTFAISLPENFYFPWMQKKPLELQC